MIKCPELVAQLKNLTELQSKLNQEIEVFSDAEESGRQERTEILIRIYGIRKEILNTDLMVEKKMARLIDRLYAEYNEADLETVCSYLEDKTDENNSLTKKELNLLYQIDEKINVMGLIMINDVLKHRDYKVDLADFFDCSPEQIASGDWEDPVNEVIFYYGNFEDKFGDQKKIKYPQRVGGDFTITKRLAISDTKLPKRVGGSVFMNDTRAIIYSDFPEIIEDNLYLQNIKVIGTSTMPKRVGKHLIMNSIESAFGVVLPKFVGKLLDLNRLRSAMGVVFPDEVGGDIYLAWLESDEGLVLPKIVGGTIHFGSFNQKQKDEIRQKYPNLKIV